MPKNKHLSLSERQMIQLPLMTESLSKELPECLKKTALLFPRRFVHILMYEKSAVHATATITVKSVSRAGFKTSAILLTVKSDTAKPADTVLLIALAT